MPTIGVERYIHVVAGLIRDPSDPTLFFITRRKEGQHLEHLWEFPGGKLKSGEPPLKGLRRELEEEVGIRVISAFPFKSVKHRYPEKNILLDVWEVQSFSGSPEGREGQESCWASASEMCRLPFPPADQPVLEALECK